VQLTTTGDHRNDHMLYWQHDGESLEAITAIIILWQSRQGRHRVQQ
jgi:hypothetical protein